MENQDSTPQEKKKFFNLTGKKKKIVIAFLAVFVLLGMIGRGIGFHRGWGDRGYSLMGSGSGAVNVAVAAKDFESMGIVFAESTSATRNGYRATYNALMKEAAKKGADAIINVNIYSSGMFFNRTWSGSATAIKYLETVSGETSLISDIGNTALMLRNGRSWRRNRF